MIKNVGFLQSVYSNSNNKNSKPAFNGYVMDTDLMKRGLRKLKRNGNVVISDDIRVSVNEYNDSSFMGLCRKTGYLFEIALKDVAQNVKLLIYNIKTVLTNGRHEIAGGEQTTLLSKKGIEQNSERARRAFASQGHNLNTESMIRDTLEKPFITPMTDEAASDLLTTTLSALAPTGRVVKKSGKKAVIPPKRRKQAASLVRK